MDLLGGAPASRPTHTPTKKMEIEVSGEFAPRERHHGGELLLYPVLCEEIEREVSQLFQSTSGRGAHPHSSDVLHLSVDSC